MLDNYVQLEDGNTYFKDDCFICELCEYWEINDNKREHEGKEICTHCLEEEGVNK